MKTSTALTVAGVTVAGGVLAYAVYFDYKRRNDTDFRKKLRKEKKRVDKNAAQSRVEDKTATSPTTEQLQAALANLQQESLPQSPQEKEHYFMTQVSLGEQLGAQGPAFNLPSALAFYRALRVYPSPVELIVLYEKSVPQPVFKIVMELMNLDVSSASPPSVGHSASDHPNISDEEDETSPSRGGPPSEASSQEWDKLTDPGTQTPAS